MKLTNQCDFLSVTEDGKVFSHKSNKFLKQIVGITGYYVVSVRLGGRGSKAMCFKVHRLVASAFIANTDSSKTQVNHIDGNKLNNSVTNLEWVTPSENVRHAVDTGLLIHAKGEECSYSKLTDDDIKFIRDNFIPGDRNFGYAALARILGVEKTAVRRAALKIRWKHID